MATEEFLRTESGIPLRHVYGPDDRAGTDEVADIGAPGAFPFTRGVRLPSSKRARFIERELSGEGSPRWSNAQLKMLLAQGQTGLDVIGDAPTVAMMDPDHPYARYTVGTQGVSMCRLQDWHDLYDGVPIEELTLSHSLPAIFSVAGLWALAKSRGVDPRILRGSAINGPYYGEDTGYAVHMPFELRLRLAVDTIEFAASEMPRFHGFVEDTYYIADGGLDAIEEMALGFVEIRGVIRELLTRGVDIDTFAPRIAILVNCRMDLFEEVAKIRATRRMFARMMRDEFGAKDPRSWAVNITAHTSGMSLTAQQPVNNVVRGSIQALALAMAGVQAMEVSAFDEAFRTPSREAHEVGLRTQQIVQLESGAGRVADPLGGSWYVESLTDELERRIDAMTREIEARGDPAELADGGYFRGIFSHAMERHARQVADGSLPKVGVNCFVVPPEHDTLLRAEVEGKFDPDSQRIRDIVAWKADRDLDALRRGLDGLRLAADDRHANLTPYVVSAYEDGATMGEMARVLRESYGWPADPLASRAATEVR